VDKLQPVHQNSALVKYADDLTIIHFVRTNEEDKLVDEWTNIKQWCSSAQLTPNAKKTKIMDVVTNTSLATLTDIIDDGAKIEKVKTVKLLGITLSSDLKWNEHVEDVCCRAARRLYSLVTLRSIGVPTTALMLFYACTIRSLLLYASPAWCNHSKNLGYKLEKIERRAKR
jgi:hypothetical protein